MAKNLLDINLIITMITFWPSSEQIHQSRLRHFCLHQPVVRDYGSDGDEAFKKLATLVMMTVVKMVMKALTSTSSTMSFNSLSDILSPILRSTVPSSCLFNICPHFHDINEKHKRDGKE